MGYHDDVRKKIMLEGMDKSPGYAKRKAEEYQKSAATNYRLYKTANSKKEAQLRYVDSQNAYVKAEVWKEVLAILVRKLSDR